jgi:hypothetical protein
VNYQPVEFDCDRADSKKVLLGGCQNSVPNFWRPSQAIPKITYECTETPNIHLSMEMNKIGRELDELLRWWPKPQTPQSS